jgi:hypothetical protein
VEFIGDNGSVHVRRESIDANPKSLLVEKIGANEIRLYKSNNHKRNWLGCIKSRAVTIAPVETAHRSCTVCLLGSVAMRAGRKILWDPKTEKIVGDAEAAQMQSRSMRPPWKL